MPDKKRGRGVNVDGVRYYEDEDPVKFEEMARKKRVKNSSRASLIRRKSPIANSED